MSWDSTQVHKWGNQDTKPLLYIVSYYPYGSPVSTGTLSVFKDEETRFLGLKFQLEQRKMGI